MHLGHGLHRLWAALTAQVRRVVVIGAGIAGLAAATFLDGPDIDLRVVEGAPQPGGSVRTEIEGGRVLDRAANGWLDNEPAMARLLDVAGLSDRIVPAADAYGVRWIHADGALHPAPLGPGAFARSGLLTPGAKLRVLLEPFLPRGGFEGETIGAFVARRLGPAMVDRMVGPMVAGIYAADPYDVSLAAAFPRMAQLEREYRSLFLAMVRLRRGGAPSGHLQTLRGGAGALTVSLAARLGDRLVVGAPARALVRDGTGWRVDTDGGSYEADAVVVACPAGPAADLVAPHDEAAGRALEGIAYSPVTVVATAWSRDAFTRPPVGFGVLASRDSDLDGVLGAVFTSNVFPSQAPDDEVLIRAFVGGSIAPEAAALDDEALTERVVRALETFQGPAREAPRMVRVFRHPRGIPRYRPGHVARVAAVRAAEVRLPGLAFTGNHLDGIGVKDQARQAERVVATLGQPSTFSTV